jgi:N-glycosylase/DNA lyase
MINLINKINLLKKDPISKIILQRINEFENYRTKNKSIIFSELCFCLLTANFKADKCIQIQKELDSGFEILSKEELADLLKIKGHRFWPQRADRIVRAREYKEELFNLVFKTSEIPMRSWLVENIYGLGMKEASHFLRNIGYKDVAIIDFHIIDLLVGEGLIKKPNTITPKKYIEIEDTLRILGGKVNLNLAELDLYLWYIETGKVLK